MTFSIIISTSLDGSKKIMRNQEKNRLKKEIEAQPYELFKFTKQKIG